MKYVFSIILCLFVCNINAQNYRDNHTNKEQFGFGLGFLYLDFGLRTSVNSLCNTSFINAPFRIKGNECKSDGLIDSFRTFLYPPIYFTAKLYKGLKLRAGLIAYNNLEYKPTANGGAKDWYENERKFVRPFLGAEFNIRLKRRITPYLFIEGQYEIEKFIVRFIQNGVHPSKDLDYLTTYANFHIAGGVGARVNLDEHFSLSAEVNSMAAVSRVSLNYFFDTKKKGKK